MNNPAVLKVFSALSFIVSAIFTVMLLTSQAVGAFSTLLAVVMAIILEFAKCFFLYKSINDKNLDKSVRAVTVVIAGILFLSSIVASLSFMFNQNNETKNRAIKNSSVAKEQIRAKGIQEELYKTKKLELEQMISDKERQISAMEKNRDSWGKNYISMRQNAQNDINSVSVKLQDAIDARSRELSTIASQIQAPVDLSKAVTYSTSGYTAFLNVVAQKLNQANENKEDPWTTEQLEVLLFTMIAVVFEFVAVFLLYIYQRENVSGNLFGNSSGSLGNGVVSQNIIDLNNQKKNLMHGVDISRDDLDKYLKYMYENARENVSPGYKTIAEKVCIDGENARKIKGFLERIGVIETVGNRTIILMDYDEDKLLRAHG